MATITEQIVADEAADLAEGGRRFTPRQLYYATCAAVEAPRVAMAPGAIGVALILLLLAVVTSHAPVVPVVLAVLGFLFLLYGARLRTVETHRLKSVRARALNYDDFVSTFLAPHRGSPDHFPGLLDVDQWRPRADAGRRAALIVCDSVENAALVAEVLREESLEADVIDTDSAGPLLAGREGIIAVHDASLRGCALPLALGDGGAVAVNDLGVRPRDVTGQDLQVIEGAPGARPPRDLTTVLDADEVAWFYSGYRLELAAFPKERLASRLRRALTGEADDEAAGQAPGESDAVGAADAGGDPGEETGAAR